MTINRHNYETFFLLYVDNELSPAERKAVEKFVQENKDLETELQLLLETTLSSETVSFEAKAVLYKNEAELDAIQKNLLLHLDNELSPVAAAETSSLIALDHTIKHEWEILQQTKLDATEKIVFENKELLYRHEKGRVISIRFWRVAAAAAILFACLFTIISLLKKDGVTEEVVKKEAIKPSIEKQTNNSIVPGKDAVDTLQTNVPAENTASVNDKEQNKNATPTIDIKTNTVQAKKEIDSKDQLVKEQKNILQKTSLDNINNPKSNETSTAVVIEKNKETISINTFPAEMADVPVKEKITAPKAPIIDYNSIPAKTDSYAKTAVLDESASGNDNKILYMSEEKITRSKIGGLFRKVKRVVERNTNIKTGNGVKIAGFEIALNR